MVCKRAIPLKTALIRWWTPCYRPKLDVAAGDDSKYRIPTARTSVIVFKSNRDGQKQHLGDCEEVETVITHSYVIGLRCTEMSRVCTVPLDRLAYPCQSNTNNDRKAQRGVVLIQSVHFQHPYLFAISTCTESDDSLHLLRQLTETFGHLWVILHGGF